MVVAVLFVAGDHVPVIPLVEVNGNADKLPPTQMAETAEKIGNVDEPTVIVNVVVVAH